MPNKKPKTFADCAIYGKVSEAGFSTEKALITFIMSADRIDISSNAFKGVVSQLKSRAQTAVIVRMLQQGNVVLGIATKELSPSMKVFYAKDIKTSTKSKKVFVDVTNIITLQNGFFVCKNIDKFAAYLMGVMIMQIYYTEPNKFISNGSLQKLSVTAFIKLYCAILNELRMPGYINNKTKVQYIVGVYFAYNVIGLDMNQARLVAASSMKLNRQEAAAIDYYYTEDDFKDIYTFTESIVNTFKLKDLTVDGLINKWIYAYGKGTMYALELFPAFLTLVTYTCSGSYINNMKRIEAVLSKELVDIYNIILRIGSDTYSNGFKYESADDRERYEKQFHEMMSAHNIPMSAIHEEDDLDPQEITQDAIDQEKEDTPKTPEETDTLNKEIEKDSPMTEGFLDKFKNKSSSNSNNDPLSTAKNSMNNLSNSVNKDAQDSKDQMTKFKELADKQRQIAHRESADDIDPHEISKNGLESEIKDQGPKTPEEAKELVNDLKQDSPMTEGADELDAKEISKDAVKSEEENLPETNGETKNLKDDIVEDRVLT